MSFGKFCGFVCLFVCLFFSSLWDTDVNICNKTLKTINYQMFIFYFFSELLHILKWYCGPTERANKILPVIQPVLVSCF